LLVSLPPIGHPPGGFAKKIFCPNLPRERATHLKPAEPWVKTPFHYMYFHQRVLRYTQMACKEDWDRLVQSWRAWMLPDHENQAMIPFLEHDKFIEKLTKTI